jgi:hypothetical protein
MIRGTFRQRSASCLSFPRVREMLNRTTEGYCARDYRTAFANAQGSASVRDTAVFICSRSKGTRSCRSEMSIRNFLKAERRDRRCGQGQLPNRAVDDGGEPQEDVGTALLAAASGVKSFTCRKSRTAAENRLFGGRVGESDAAGFRELSSGFVGALGHLLLLECGSEPLDPTCKQRSGSVPRSPGGAETSTSSLRPGFSRDAAKSPQQRRRPDRGGDDVVARS